MPPRDADSCNGWHAALRILAAVAWVLIIATTSIRVLVAKAPSRTVYPIFADAGKHWRAGEHLYRPSAFWFRYSPAVAAGFAPISIWDDQQGDFAWRLLNAGAFVLGVGWWIRSMGTAGANASRTQRALLWLLAIPMSLTSFGNGQANPLVLGLLAAATVAVTRQRWNLVAVFIAVATLFKVYPLTLGLLFIVMHPKPLSWRLGSALLCGLVLPFIAQNPAYVLNEYGEWLQFLVADSRMNWDWISANRDAWLIVRRLGLPVDFYVYRAATALIGVGLAGVVLRRKQLCRTDADEFALANFAFAGGCCWMVIFGPATEACTYILLAPRFAQVWVSVLRGCVSPARRALVAVGSVLLLAAEIANFFANTALIHSFGWQPLGALLLFADVLLEALEPTFEDSGVTVVEYRKAA